MTINFTCPKCHCGVLSEIQPGIEMSNEIGSFDPETGDAEYGPASYSDGDGRIYFACYGCCEVLKDEEGNVVDTFDKLAKWIKDHDK